jgi:hypothetical protein
MIRNLLVYLKILLIEQVLEFLIFLLKMLKMLNLKVLNEMIWYLFILNEDLIDLLQKSSERKSQNVKTMQQLKV